MPARDGLTAVMDAETDTGTKQELVGWLEGRRRHVVEQFRAMPAAARGVSAVPSGWTARGVLRHLALDVERVWFRAVVAGEDVELPEGYAGWTAPPGMSDDELLDAYVAECALATRAIAEIDLHARPRWWFAGAGESPYPSLQAVLLHVIVETATHAGHLDICRELVDGGQRLVLDEPEA